MGRYTLDLRAVPNGLFGLWCFRMSPDAHGRLGPCIPAILEWRGWIVTVNAHFDGKVIIPDEPLDLRPNQALTLQIQPMNSEGERAEESALAWIAANAVDSEALPGDLADRHDHYLYGRSSGNDPR